MWIYKSIKRVDQEEKKNKSQQSPNCLIIDQNSSSNLSAGKSFFQFFYVILDLRELQSSNESFGIYPNRKLQFQSPKNEMVPSWGRIRVEKQIYK